jgi:multiple sugar transport system substrate-binding protein
MLAACGSNGKGSENAGAGQTPPPDDKPAHLVFYSTAAWSQDAFNERFGDALRKKFPNYTIEAIFNGKGTALADVISSGVTIDVVWNSASITIPQMLDYGLQYDMSELIKMYNVPINKLEPTAVNAAREMSGGKLYAIPIINNTTVLYYNKDIFDKFGAAYPKDGMTWDQAIAMARQLHRADGDIQYYGMRGGVTPLITLSPLSVPYLDSAGKPTLTTDDRWKTLFNDVVEIKKSVENKSLSFVTDPKVAMSADLANIFLNNVEKMSAMNWDLVTYPTYKEKPGVGPQSTPTLFGITSVSKQKEAAMKVLNYLLSEEVQMSYSERAVIPILQDEKIKAAFGKNSTFKDKNLQAIVKMKYAPISPMTKYQIQIEDVFNKAIPDLYSGTVDLNTSFRNMDEQIKKLIADDIAKSK